SSDLVFSSASCANSGEAINPPNKGRIRVRETSVRNSFFILQKDRGKPVVYYPSFAAPWQKHPLIPERHRNNRSLHPSPRQCDPFVLVRGYWRDLRLQEVKPVIGPGRLV